ncbi:MAG: 3-deoxy-D-manno-octulosonic acid transferase [Proteobacteria bacterium]|nr:3-deoxy-D-manno-octulosonic acid transferase [Pseudomonadota bacterium]
MSKPLHRTTLRYRALILLLVPVAITYTVYRAVKDGGWRYLLQRFGFGYPPVQAPSVLIHCASVGEFNAAKPLILRLREQYPDYHLIISTNTPTAAKLVSAQADERITHVYMPLDYPFAVNRLLMHVRPVSVLILETEIWPTLFFQTAKKSIGIAIVNGRLSEKTLRASRFFKNEQQASLKNLSLVLARSEEDYLRFLDLGAEPHSTHVTGNLKYAAARTGKSSCSTAFKYPFLLAVSTHEDEELQLAQHLPLLQEKNHLLVIAPRYPERSQALRYQLQQENWTVSLHSQRHGAAERTDIYIIDALGQLDGFFSEATLVFVGGSLISRGGHNLLEPAGFGKCTVVGPHTDNFALETKELKEAGALVQVSDNRELGLQLAHLLDNAEARNQYGENAQQFVRHKASVLDSYLRHLQPILQLR